MYFMFFNRAYQAGVKKERTNAHRKRMIFRCSSVSLSYVWQLRQANPAGVGDALQPGGDIHAIAHQVAVALLHDVAEMNAHPKFNAAHGRKSGIPLDHAVLYFDGAAYGVDDAAEFGDQTVAGALDDPPIMHADGRVDEIAAQRPQASQRALLVGARKTAESDDISGKNRRKLSKSRSSRPS